MVLLIRNLVGAVAGHSSNDQMFKVFLAIFRNCGALLLKYLRMARDSKYRLAPLSHPGSDELPNWEDDI